MTNGSPERMNRRRPASGKDCGNGGGRTRQRGYRWLTGATVLCFHQAAASASHGTAAQAGRVRLPAAFSWGAGFLTSAARPPRARPQGAARRGLLRPPRRGSARPPPSSSLAQRSRAPRRPRAAPFLLRRPRSARLSSACSRSAAAELRRQACPPRGHGGRHSPSPAPSVAQRRRGEAPPTPAPLLPLCPLSSRARRPLAVEAWRGEARPASRELAELR